jgi:hypothetical protein
MTAETIRIGILEKKSAIGIAATSIDLVILKVEPKLIA